MSALKYKVQISGLPNCPPSDCSTRKATLFRIVREDIDDPKNFQPPAILNPARKFNGDAACCSGFALSFFETVKAACFLYEGLKRRHPEIHHTLGTHLAEVSIRPDDGLLTVPSRSGHLDLHQNDATDLRPRARIVAQLHPPTGAQP